MIFAIIVLLSSLLARSHTLASTDPGSLRSAMSLQEGLGMTLEWYAPFYSGGGYSSEAFAAFQSLQLLTLDNPAFSVIARQHGDSINRDFIEGMRPEDRNSLLGASQSRRGLVVSICHSEPGAWHAPHPRYHTAHACPPPGSHFNIGRTMFETDRIPDGWLQRLQHMDEIWVPTSFSYDIFLRAGVDKKKLRIVEEAVDTELFSPLPSSTSSFPSTSSHRNHHPSLTKFHELANSNFMFLFVGKWEKRKNVEALVLAFIREFNLITSAEDNSQKDSVVLAILTASYHSNDDFIEEIKLIVKKDADFNKIKSIAEQNRIIDLIMSRLLVLHGVPQTAMPELYRGIDVLVIPSHGEGWGRPHIEAMSTGKPVIYTNWSGPTHFIDDSSGFPIQVAEKLVPTPGWSGHFWSDPVADHMRQLMRLAYSNPSGIVEMKGSSARRVVERQYSLKAMAAKFESELARIFSQLSGYPSSVEHNSRRQFEL